MKAFNKNNPLEIQPVFYYFTLIAMFLGVLFGVIADSYTSHFNEPMIIAIMSMGIIMAINKKLGLALAIVSCIDILTIQFLNSTTDPLIYAIILPLIIIAVALNTFAYRDQLDAYTLYIFGQKGRKPSLNCKQIGLTAKVWQTLQYLQKLMSTKEIATQEACSEAAIQGRLGSIYIKLEVMDRPSLMYKLGQHELAWED